MRSKCFTRCAVCGVSWDVSTVRCFKAPSCDERRRRWEESCGVSLGNSSHVCQQHFKPTDFIDCPVQTSVFKKARLFSSAVPIPLKAQHSLGAQTLNTNVRPLYVDAQTQTDDGSSESSFRAEIYLLAEKVKTLEASVADLNAQLVDAKALRTSVEKFFTAGQIHKLLHPQKKVLWGWEDISAAICLHSAGPRAFMHLYASNFPLPHITTLQSWARQIKIEEGILQFSLDCLKYRSDISEDDRVCILYFDEMKVSKLYEYDPSNKMVKKPSNYVQGRMEDTDIL